VRPEPLDNAARAPILATLPKEGEITLTAKERDKLTRADRVLDYSARRGVIEIKVVEMDQAFVGLYLRTVIMVSGQAFRLLSADELAALVAHEVGHDYHSATYAAALAAKDSAHLRELELEADGYAVLTLREAGIDPERLADAVRQMMRYNDWRFRAAGAAPSSTSSDERYVSLGERLAFIRAVAALRWGHQAAPAVASTGVTPRP
jgi:Zn-dependent protease with chaperone function